MGLLEASSRGSQALAAAWMTQEQKGCPHLLLGFPEASYITIPWWHQSCGFQQGWGKCMQGWKKAVNLT